MHDLMKMWGCFLNAGSSPDWDGTRNTHDMLYLAYSVHDPKAGAIYVGFNPHHYAITVALPEGPSGSTWWRVADTAQPPPHDIVLSAAAAATLQGGSYEVAGKAAVVFAAKPVAATKQSPAVADGRALGSAAPRAL
jgi:hypothetical protein